SHREPGDLRSGRDGGFAPGQLVLASAGGGGTNRYSSTHGSRLGFSGTDFRRGRDHDSRAGGGGGACFRGWEGRSFGWAQGGLLGFGGRAGRALVARGSRCG